LSVAIATLAIGVAAVTFWVTIRRQYDILQDVQAPDTLVPQQTEAFVPTGGGGDAYTSEGCIHDEVFRARDGSQLIFSHMEASSPAKAAKLLRKLLKVRDAEWVVERTAVVDEGGKEAGERVVVLWRAEPGDWQKASVMWTRGSEIFWG
jgi:hypothetical protein